jgi:hypothetical protein
VNRDSSETEWNADPFNADEDDSPDLWSSQATEGDAGLPPFIDPEIEAELEAEGPPDWMGIRWRDIAPEDKAQAWTALRQWVDWFIREYNCNSVDITPCWYEHADMVAELYAGMCAEYKIWEEGSPGLGAMTTWHPHVQAMKVRLAAMVAARQCSAKAQHQDDPVDLPFTYDTIRWAAVRDSISVVTELPRTDANRYWRPVTGDGTGELVHGEEVFVGSLTEASAAILGTTILSGADARTVQVRHTAPANQSASYWEHSDDKTGWTQHPDEESANVSGRTGSDGIPENERVSA